MKVFCAALLATLVAICPAVAQGAAGTWQHLPIEGGCTIVTADVSNAANVPTRWDQLCEPGRPIEGYGTLRAELTDEGLVLSFTGTFISGVPHGTVVMRAYDAVTGELTDEESDNYDMGCQVGDASCSPYRPA